MKSLKLTELQADLDIKQAGYRENAEQLRTTNNPSERPRLQRVQTRLEREITELEAQIRQLEALPDHDDFSEYDRQPETTPPTNRRVRSILIAVSVIVFLALIAAVIYFLPKPETKVDIAYSFLVDTSAVMNEPLNGVPRAAIVAESIKRIVNAPIGRARQIWKGLRVTGGGDQCNQTNLLASGTQVNGDEFVLRLSSMIPSGANGYEVGINGLVEDFSQAIAFESDVKIAFIFFGSLDLSPCRDYDIPTALRSLAALRTNTTFCSFALLQDDPRFAAFQQAMANEGFSCVYNVKSPDDISSISVGVIEQIVDVKVGDIEKLTPVDSEDNYVASATPEPTVATLTPTPTLSPTPSITATDTPTDDGFIDATATMSATLQCFYEVQSGNTLSSIALILGVSQQDLVNANGITNPNLLYSGQRLMNPNCVTTSPTITITPSP